MLIYSSSRFLFIFVKFYPLSQAPIIRKASASGALRQQRTLSVIRAEFYFIGSIDDHSVFNLHSFVYFLTGFCLTVRTPKIRLLF